MAASDLNGVLQDLGVILNPTQTAFLIQASFPSHTSDNLCESICSVVGSLDRPRDLFL